MKRPARLKTLQSSAPMPTQSNFMLSRMPLLQGGGNGDIDSFQSWTAGDQVPGLLIPIAFLSSLRANLQICASDPEDIYGPPSPVPTISRSFKPPASVSRHPLATEVTVNDASIPILPASASHPTKDYSPADSPITTIQATTEADTAAALELIADSVSQQRQIAAKAIVSHPLILAISIIVFLSSVKILYTGSMSDMILMLAVWATFAGFALISLNYMLQGYAEVISRVGSWPWLSESSVHGVSHKRDEILVAKQDGEVIGVVVLRIAKAMTSPDIPGVRPRSSRRKSSARWTGIIRGWTVKRNHRLRGVGSRLLADVVANCRLRALDGPILANDHANSTRLLPGMFNTVFEKQEKWARGFLEQHILAERGR